MRNSSREIRRARSPYPEGAIEHAVAAGFIALISAASGWANPAFAQTGGDGAAGSRVAHAPSDTISTSGAEIIVTGSQISRSGQAPSTTLLNVGPDYFTRDPATNVADALNDVPALQASVTPSSAGTLSKLAGNNYLDLRGLGYLRTLTLIDGKRYVPTTTEGAISINLLPQALIESVDVATGGASAAYGSDAVAGVVNIRLDNDLVGIRATLQGGITDHNDNRNYLASIGYGARFANERGQVLIGLESAENSGIRDFSRREWAGNHLVIFNPGNASDPSQPELVHVADGRYAFASEGGVITSGSLQNTKFGPGGTTSPFNFGTLVTDGNTMNGGDGDPIGATQVMETPQRRYSVYAGLKYGFADALKAYASFNYSRSSFNERSISSDDTFTIQADNAFLPENLRAALASADETSFDFGRGSEDYGVGRIKQNAHTWQFISGLKGAIGKNWTYDVSYSDGQTRTLTLFEGDVIQANRLLAIDAVFDPASGQTVCRSSLSDPTNGCVPLNLFGEGSPSQAAINYITGTSRRDWHIDQQTADLVLRGTPFDTWAGPVSVAIGGEWRRLSVDVRSDPLSATPNAMLFRLGNTKPYLALESVREGFAEVELPLARDQKWADSIVLDLAGRVTNYRTSGTVATWKTSMDYAINKDLRVQGAWSRDIRAPNINELFLAGQTLVGTITDSATGSTYSTTATTRGNPSLKPEKARAVTAGLVLTPSQIPNLTVTGTYFNINIKGAIDTLSGETIIDRCNAGAAQFCQMITRGSDGFVTNIVLTPLNYQRLETSGFDLGIDYRFSVQGLTVDLHGTATYTHKLNLIDADGTTERLAGDTEQPATDGVGGRPHWKAEADATIADDRSRFSVTGRYIGGGVITRDDITLDRNHVSGRLYVDLKADHRLMAGRGDGGLSVFCAIRNLFDKDPPFTGYDGQTAYQLYDMIGRQYTVGLRFRM